MFDRWSATYDRPALQRAIYHPLHAAVLARVRNTDPATVVDLGCGTGVLTQRLVGTFPEALVIGIDLSPGMLTEAAARAREPQGGGFQLLRADAEDLPLARSSVDLLVCTESFHWYRHQDRALAGIAQVLRPGGRLVIASIAAFTAIGDRLVREATRFGPNPVRALPPHRLRALLVRSGFDVLHQRRIRRRGTLAWPILTDARLAPPT